VVNRAVLLLKQVINFGSMLDQFNEHILTNQLVKPGERVILAVSGGIDSVVMTHLFHLSGISFIIAHANFQLRGDESKRDELFVTGLAKRYGAELFVRIFDTRTFARKHKLSVQVAARQLRYDWFDELLIKTGCDRVATAHHLDDQAETFLINLTRGTGIAGLHGIPVSQGRIIRPVLFASRKEIESYAFDNQLDCVEDSSNKSLKYTRNRIRHKVIPELEKINPSFKQTINETVRIIRESEEIYRKSIEELRNSTISTIDNKAIISIPAFFGLDPLNTLAYELLSPFGFNKSDIRDIIGLKEAASGKEVMSGSHRLVRDRDDFIIVPRHDIIHNQEFEIHWHDIGPGIIDPVTLHFEVIHETPGILKTPSYVALIDLDKLVFPLRLRKWKRGDHFMPFGMKTEKKLSDFFIDLKLSRIEKENLWLLCSGNEIVWIIGKRTDDRFKVTDRTINILKISLQDNFV
jgi:tRNA(Ile)-lysidine synthase